MGWVGIDSDNGLSFDHRQAITWTNVEFLSIGPLGTNFSLKFGSKYCLNTKHFIHENAFDYVVCKMASIFPRRDELTVYVLDCFEQT